MRPSGTGWLPGDLHEFTPDGSTQEYWDAARRHELVAYRCNTCGRYRLPASPLCPTCQSNTGAWSPLPGRGELFSFTVVRHAVVPALTDSIPYAIGLVSLAEGQVRLVTNLVNCDVEAIGIGDAVQVIWDDVSDTVTIPRFEPVGGDA